MIKIGIVGLGPIGSMHAENLKSGKIPNAVLHCACEQKPVDESKYPGVKIFKDTSDMFANGGMDAVIISTPSFTHYPLGIAALNAGLHTLVEKPVALCTADADELSAAARKAGKLCAVMLNQRTTPLYARIKQLVQSGELGEINRVDWTMTNWYRPDIYFTSSPWRGTWKGEAGGALLNQSIHNIDIFAWVFGMPKLVRAWCKFGKYHSIEVEDEVCCRMELSNGSNATFTTSTGEYPGLNRLTIAADKGFVVAENDTLKITRYKNGSLKQYTQTTKYMFGSPETEDTVETFEGKGEQHVGVLKNFVGAIEGREKLDYAAEEGKKSLEISNLMLLSAWKNSEVSSPIDSAEYKKILEEKSAASKLRENPKTDFIVEFQKSFK